MYAPLFLPSPPALCRYLFPLLCVVYVRATAVSSSSSRSSSRSSRSSSSGSSSSSSSSKSSCLRVIFIRAAGINSVNSMCILFSTYNNSTSAILFLQPFFPSPDLLASHCSEHLSYVLFCSVFFFFCSLFLRCGLICCVLAPGTLSTLLIAFNLLYLDESRLFDLLCFAVCDHIIFVRISLDYS